MGILLGRWDCKYCSQKGIPANIRHCPGCGSPVGQDVKYYLPTGSADYVDPQEVPKGSDWKCTYCESYNRYEDKVCSNCGASRQEGTDYFKIHSEVSEDSHSTYHSNVKNSFEERIFSDKHENDTEAYSHGGSYSGYAGTQIDSRNWIKWLLAGLAIIAAVIGIIISVTPKERILTVDGFSWERTLYIDKYRTVNESGWNMPAGARLQYTRSEVRSYDRQLAGYRTETYTEREIDYYEKYVAGYEDQGNGYFKEIYDSRPVYKTVTKTREVPYYVDVPVYDTKYYYEIDKWVAERSIATKGTDKEPYWGKEPLSGSTIPKIGDERVSSRSEQYYIVGTVAGSETSQSYSVTYSDWIYLNERDNIRCKVYISGKIILLDVIDEET